MGFDLYEESEPLEEASTGQVQNATAVVTDEPVVGGVVDSIASIASIVPNALGFIGKALGIGSSETPDDVPAVATSEPAEEKDIQMEVETDIQMEQELSIPDIPSTDSAQPLDGTASAQLSEDALSTAVDEPPQTSGNMSTEDTDGFRATVGSIDEPVQIATTPEPLAVASFRRNHNENVKREQELMEQRGEDTTAFLEEQKTLGDRTIADMTNAWNEAIERSRKDSSFTQTAVTSPTSSPEKPLVLRRSMTYGADNNVTRVMDDSSTLGDLRDNITRSGIKNKGRAIISAIHDTLENMGADKLSSDLQESLLSGISSIAAGTKGFKQLAKTRASELGTAVTEWLHSNGLAVTVGGILSGAVVMTFVGKYAHNKLRRPKFNPTFKYSEYQRMKYGSGWKTVTPVAKAVSEYKYPEIEYFHGSKYPEIEYFHGRKGTTPSV